MMLYNTLLKYVMSVFTLLHDSWYYTTPTDIQTQQIISSTQTNSHQNALTKYTLHPPKKSSQTQHTCNHPTVIQTQCTQSPRHTVFAPQQLSKVCIRLAFWASRWSRLAWGRLWKHHLRDEWSSPYQTCILPSSRCFACLGNLMKSSLQCPKRMESIMFIVI